MNFLQLYQKQLKITPADGIMGPITAKAIMLDLGITDKIFACHLLAQIAHESGLYRNARENLNYNEAGLLNIFRKYFINRGGGRDAAFYAHKPELIANYVYANRNGNGDEASGDGWKYRGIFGLQLTGKYNIQAFIKYLGLPPNTEPDSLLEDPRNYFLSGLYWFMENGVDKLCTSTKETCIVAVTRRVNGGTNGLDDRIKQTKTMFKALGLA
jgi:putative chitinase